MARESRSGKKDENENRHGSDGIGRRGYLATTGAAASTLFGGLALGSNSAVAAPDAGPSNPEDWALTFEDTFDGGTLDRTKWDVGFGWGMTSSNDDADVSEDCIHVNDGLTLEIDHSGNGIVTQGAINTRDIRSFGPGHYFEARMKMPGREGILPAFWSKPNDESWPPEIDFIELFQTGSSSDTTTAHYNIHYSTSGVIGDGSTHEQAGSFTHDAGRDLSETYNRYGCAWFDDRIEFYFNGTHVRTVTDSSVVDAVNAGAPFYMMFTNHVNRIGTPDYSEPWTETMEVDWCRVWEYDPGSGSSPSDGNDEDSTEEDNTSDDGDSEPAEEHYFWVRSEDGSDVSYEFEVSGSIGIDPNEQTSLDDEWVAADGTTAGGTTVNGGTNGDGFRYTGEITDLSYDGPIQTYVDDEPVDPTSLSADDSANDGSEEQPEETDESTDDESESIDKSSEKYLWLRSADGSQIFYNFRVTGSVRIDENEQTDNTSEWLYADESAAYGVTSGGGKNGDGFWYTGEIELLRYQFGELETYLDDEYVDPDSIGN